MCLAVPALVLSIDGPEAEVDFSGVRRRISVVLTPDVQVGDYVIIHTGFAINVLDQEEAAETLKLWRELEEFNAQLEIEERDRGSSRLPVDGT
jgi:hydrogenase expression/formation protein HypC